MALDVRSLCLFDLMLPNLDNYCGKVVETILRKYTKKLIIWARYSEDTFGKFGNAYAWLVNSVIREK